MCGECAPNTAVSHKIAIAKNWKKLISPRQDQVTFSSVIQSAEHRNWYTLGNWLHVFHEIRTANTYKKILIEQSQVGILIESIALNTAAGQKCVRSASSF